MRPRTHRLTVLAALGAALAITACVPAPGAAQERPQPQASPVPVLVVSGNGESRATPDEARVRLGVTRQTASARDAQQAVNNVAQAILAAVTKMGVPKEDIQTSQLTLQPVYSQGQPGMEPRIRAYQASNIITIRLTRLPMAGPVIDAGLEAGANRLDSLEFGLREDVAARSQALRLAVQEAQAKARVMADALGVRLVRVLEISEGGFNVRPPVFMESAMMARGGVETPVSPGQVGVSATVSIRYQIADAAGR